MTPRQHVHSELTQEEKRQVLRDTMHTRAVAEQGAVGGRWAAETKARVVGSAPFKYPELPPNSPWASDPLPASEPLGFPIDEMQPVGEPHEVAASLGEVNPDAAGSLLPVAVEQALPGDGQRSGMESVQPSAPAARRRRSQKGTP
jgi:hypothetical protein